MAARTSPPFRADQVGSLKRPKALMDARERLLGAHDRDRNFGPHDNAELRKIEDAAIRDVVRLQESVGIRAITDGEFRRRIWWSDFILSLENVSGNYRGRDNVSLNAAGGRMPLPLISITGKIRWTHSVNVAPFKFLQSAIGKGGTAKVTLPAPQTVYFYTERHAVDAKAYPDVNDHWNDLTDAYIAEVRALGAAGCRYIQFDEVVTACLCDERQRAYVRSRGDDPDALLRTYIDSMNRIIAAKPADMAVTLHTCRGNLQGHWFAEGGYDPIAEYLFANLNVDGYLLEYDTPRAGSFAPLRFLPKGKIAALGLVSTKSPELEPIDLLKRRIEDAAKHAPLEQLALCPQCGFSSNYLGNPITEEIEKAKIARVVETARAVWGDT
jgi:5-methyltetrahydropteroyltriglutamate--homocysteine methyltransferase